MSSNYRGRESLNYNTTQKIFFTGDTHFGHKNILKYTDRGKHFTTVQEMDEYLINEWNSQVSEGDIVYHLGDFYMGHPDKISEVISQLNGEIHLIRGNHDKFHPIYNKLFASISPYKILRVNDDRIVLFHYPITDWDGKYRGAYHFFGHTHGRIVPNNRSIDVGVDSIIPYHINKSPETIFKLHLLEDLINILKDREF